MNFLKYRILSAFTSVLVLVSCLIVSSCSEDLLDSKPLSDISDVDIFNDDVLMESYVNGTYRSFRFFQFGAFHTDGISDDAVNNSFVGYNRGLITPDDGEDITQGAWNGDYANIKKINIFFDRIEGSQATPEIVSRLTAEMRFVRAYVYFDLINFYGDVPLITTLFELDQESYDTPRNSYDEVVNFIASELDLAIPNLPSEAFDGNTGRATKGAVMGLKARTLLYAASQLNNPSNDMAKWTAARDANKAVTELSEYERDADYSNIFNEMRSHEVMFAKGFTNNNPVLTGWLQPWNTGIDRYYLPPNYFGAVDVGFFKPLHALVDAYETVDGSPVDPSNPYANRDPRLDMTVIHHGSAINGNIIEYHIDGSDPANTALAGPASFLNGGTSTHYNVLKQTDPVKAATFGSEPHEKPWVYMRWMEFI